MTAEEIQQYREQLLRDYALGPLYVPRRFSALPESGNVSSDLEFRTYGMLREREPTLKEVLTHPSIAIVADSGAGKSVVGRASVEYLLAHSNRVPVFAEVKQYRFDLPTLLSIATPAAVLESGAMVDGVPAKRTYVLDGIDEIPMELVQRLGAELREFMTHEPEAHFVFTARQAFYVANRNLLPLVPAVFHILPFATEDIEQYCANAGIDPDRFMEAIHGVGAGEEVRNPFILSVRPLLETKVLFRGIQGRLELDLSGKNKSEAGAVLPTFYSLAGEEIAIPKRFQEAIRAITRAVNCIGCSHCHFSRASNGEKMRVENGVPGSQNSEETVLAAEVA